MWDGQRRRLVLANDATGALLLFRARYRDGWIWSSEPGVLPRAGKLDVLGLRSLVSIGYQADSRTLDTAIDTMPPATTDVVKLADSRIICKRYSGLPETIDRHDTYETVYCDLLRDAIRKRLRTNEPVDLALTGGMDSRLLLGEAIAVGKEVRTFTLATGDPRDMRLARRVAAVAGVEHLSLIPEPTPVRRHGSLLRSALHTTNDWHAAQQLAICGAEHPGRLMLIGFLGGTLAGAFVDRWSAATGVARMRAGALAPYLGGINASAIAWCDVPSVPYTEVIAELIENLYGRQRRYISYLVRLSWNFGRPICPFADVRLLQCALAARREELAGQRVRTRTLRHRNPRLARIATTDDATSVGPVVPRLVRNAIRRTRVMRPIRAVVPVPLGFDYQRVQPLADECRALVTDPASRSLLAGLSPMATLALAPILMDADSNGSIPVEIIESMLRRN
jgi:hypothetical protein